MKTIQEMTMKKHLSLLLSCLICSLLIAASGPGKIKHETHYTPFAIGAVRLVNGIGEINHPQLDWDSIPIFSHYNSDAPGEATVSVCWAVSSRMQICSSDPNDNSIYTFAIYDGKAPGVIFPKEQ